MENYTDEQLITNYLEGDKEALEILIKRYLKSIYSFVYRYVGNAGEAEDITQEVFVKVWKNLKKPALSHSALSSWPKCLSKGFDPKKGTFKTWIFTIAKNTSIDWLKKKKTVPFSNFENQEGENILTETLADSSPRPDELLERVSLGEVLNAAMNQLAPKYRLVLFLRYNRYNDQFTFREIAESLEESINTVKSRHRRALIQLKKLLAET